MWTWVWAMLGVAALGLGGCNFVTSSTPMFSEADTHGQAQLRPGVWMEEHQSCEFDSSLPIGQWPQCANGWVERPGEILGPKDRGAPKAAWIAFPTVLAAGDPPVFQLRLGEAQGLAFGYVYADVRPLKLDAEGRITELESWPALCGPPPPPDPSGKELGGVTKEPIAGLTVDPKNKTCVATTPGPVRVSAKRSEAWADSLDKSKWVRDGER